MSRARTKTTLTVGHVTHDRLGDTFFTGGSAYYGARTFSALGARSRLVTVAGAEFERDGDLRGLEIARRAAPRTTTFENSYLAGGARVQHVGAVAPPITPEVLPSAWRHADIVFLAPVFGEVDSARWRDAVDAPIVGVGLQGLLKRAGPRGTALEAVTADALRRVVPTAPLDVERLRGVDVALLSEDDLAELAHPTLLRELRAIVPLVVVTRGERGSHVYTRTGEHTIGAYRTDARDPTGAGDSFAATFLFGLAEGRSPPAAAQLASAAASIVVEDFGGAALDRVGECRGRSNAVPVFDDAGPGTVR